MNLPSAGYLPSSSSLLYKISSGKVSHISLVNLQNEDTTSRTVNLFIKVLNTNLTIRILPVDMEILITDGIHYNTLIVLGDNCEIWGYADVANKVSYLISGQEL